MRSGQITRFDLEIAKANILENRKQGMGYAFVTYSMVDEAT